MQRHLYVGYCGFLEHVSIAFIDKTDPSDPLKREDYLWRTLCTMAPYGLAIVNNVLSNPFGLIVKIIFIFKRTFNALRY